MYVCREGGGVGGREGGTEGRTEGVSGDIVVCRPLTTSPADAVLTTLETVRMNKVITSDCLTITQDIHWAQMVQS